MGLPGSILDHVEDLTGGDDRHLSLHAVQTNSSDIEMCAGALIAGTLGTDGSFLWASHVFSALGPFWLVLGTRELGRNGVVVRFVAAVSF